MPDDPLCRGKGWPGMTQGPMRGAALAAALAVVACERARDCPRALAVFTGPSRQKGGCWRACPGQPQSEPSTGGCLPRPSRTRLAPAGRLPPDMSRRDASCASSGSENAGRCQATGRGAKPPIVTLRGGSPTVSTIALDLWDRASAIRWRQGTPGSTACRYGPEGGVRDARHVDLTGPGRHVPWMAPRSRPCL